MAKDDKNTSLTEVTVEQWPAIRKDLEDLLEVTQKKDEPLEAYALRLAKRATDQSLVTDDDWETLKETTQMWVNGAIEADEKGTPLPLPPGETADAPAKAAGESPAKGAKVKADKKSPKPAPAKAEPAAAPKAAKGAKKPAAEKATAPKKADGEARRGRKPKHGEDAVIKLTSAENPHRKGAKDHEKYVQLKRYDGKTIGKATAAGVDLSYLRYLEKRELVTIQAAG